MFAKERHEIIMQKLQQDGSVRVSFLVREFGVSVETIRRDLEHLEKEGHLKRVHGGAVLEKVNSKQLTSTVRETKYIEEKKEIAKKAIEYVTEGQSIAIDVSTTNTEFAKALKTRFTQLTVLTNSMEITKELSDMPDYTILFAGGIVRNQELCTIGDLAEQFVSNFHIDTFFMSMSGISLNKGFTDYGIGEIQVKKKMLENAQQGIVLADSSKFDVVSLVKVCDFHQVSRIITDSKLNEPILEKYKDNGVEVIV
ncbi:DeoR/GlpR family DNA-binding transcription regulator [Salirhabdus salicampi]|uniref:DeoR/GlpR family DNA-binding transcription regulator n=1 Tax=Salirhabdus salicampi TaxID=476102 RepID=UPI0020C1C65A|nr:DeoR/GlpR family DNA-binding transcription regulator [Salirhabdus salicampi]MCP8615839.1 DeoR/GlpR family DNA-binding transcription regulator [Salirhabdus salicampi]